MFKTELALSEVVAQIYTPPITTRPDKWKLCDNDLGLILKSQSTFLLSDTPRQDALGPE